MGLSVTALLPVTSAGFSGTNQNVGNSFDAASSFATPLAYFGTGPVATRTSSGTLTVSYPTGVTANDLLLLIEANSANQNITTPSGWSLLSDAATSSPSQFRLTIWWRLAPVSGSTVDLAVNTNSNGANAWIVAYHRSSGYPPNPQAAAISIATGSNGATTNLTPSPDLTTSQNSAAVISVAVIRASNSLSFDTARSFTPQLEAHNANGQAVTLGLADRTDLPTSTTVSSPTWSQTGTAAQWAWATLAFA